MFVTPFRSTTIIRPKAWKLEAANFYPKYEPKCQQPMVVQPTQMSNITWRKKRFGKPCLSLRVRAMNGTT